MAAYASGPNCEKIKCDETRPNCQMCQLNNEQCPGFSRPLRWSSKHEMFRQPTRARGGNSTNCTPPEALDNQPTQGDEVELLSSVDSTIQVDPSNSPGHRQSNRFDTHADVCTHWFDVQTLGNEGLSFSTELHGTYAGDWFNS